MWRTRVVPLPDVRPLDVRRWRELADRAIEPNMFLDPRYLVPAGRRPDAQNIQVVFAEYDEQLRGVLQFALGKLEDRWPASVASTGPAGSFMAIHADRHHPLVAPEEPAETVQALLRGISRSARVGLTLLRYLPGDGPLWAAVADAVEGAGFRSLERMRRNSAYVRTRPTAAPDGIVDTSHMSSRSRKEYRRLTRVLERDAAGPLRVLDRAADPALLKDFLDFESSGWKGDPAQGGGAFRLDPARERWYHEVVRGFSEDGHLIAPTVMAGDQTVSMALDFVSGGAAFGFADSCNEAFLRSSPGAIGRLAEWAYIIHHADVSHFDPSLDPWYAASTRLYPDRRDHVDLLIGTSPFGVGVVRGLPAARRVRDRLRPS